MMATERPSFRDMRLEKKTNPPDGEWYDVRFHVNLLPALSIVGVISLQKSGSGELHRLWNLDVILQNSHWLVKARALPCRPDRI